MNSSKVMFDTRYIRNKNGVLMGKQDNFDDLSKMALKTANQNNHDQISDPKPKPRVYLR